MKTITVLFIINILCSCNVNDPKVKTGHEGKPMPSIEILMADGITHFNTNKISFGKPTILFAFEPWCPFCRAQTRSIITHIDSLQNVNILMLCNSPLTELIKYCKQYKLENYPNIKVGIDRDHSLTDYFKLNSVPYLAIYNSNRKLNQVLIGNNNILTIKKIAFK